ncbi:MAG: TrbG/VirB9 family P-type conjugative transfer protein [Bryobacteraceae bacterium]|jgi:type IV secretory pathway VirB9-like protein
MKKIRVFLGCLVLGFSALAADNPKTSDSTKPLHLSRESRKIVFHVGAIEEIYCRVNDETLIQLPEGEEALVVQGGDAAPHGTWLYQTAANGAARRYVGVKPSVAGSSTTLHIITNHNIPYSFLVREVSGAPITADVSVRVMAGDDLEAKVIAPVVLMAAEEGNRYKQEAAEAVAKLEAQRKASEASVQAQLNRYRADYSKQIDHNYRFDRLKAPFHVTDVSTDGSFTYIYVDPKHAQPGTPYVVDGAKKEDIPNWSYDAEKGVYSIQGVVKHGSLRFKKDRQEFSRLGEGN